jgi:hypothetical protein
LRKITLIFFLGIAVSGCSVTRNSSKTLSADKGITFSDNVLEDVKRQNITNNGFFIQKAEVEIVTQTMNENFIATIKFSFPDRYLISLKTRTGIEGARIYINKDSVIVNDRINKKLYFVNELYLEKNFGISQDLLAVIFGDIVVDSRDSSKKVICVSNRSEAEFISKGVRFRYLIDCEKRKSVSTKLINNYVQNGVEIEYRKFIKRSGVLIPGEIEVVEAKTNTKIIIKILKIESPWNGNFDFIPGKGYELIELV